MPNNQQYKEEKQLTTIIATMPHGASVGELMEDTRLDFSRRTLQRRLGNLTASGIIKASGSGRGRRYFSRVPYESDAGQPQPRENYQANPHYVPMGWMDDGTDLYASASVVREGGGSAAPASGDDGLSLEAREIKRLVNRPLSQRIPVGYNADFLREYLPNQTYYLPETTRKELAMLGQVGVSELPAGTYLRQILDRILIDLSWNSSRLEGNTYSLLETERLLKLGELVHGKATQETQMILNHKAAIEMLADQAEEIGFNRYTICNIHALLSDNLLPDSASCGRLRDRAVGIGGSVFHPLEVPQLIEEYYQLILIKAGQIQDPFEASFFVMVHMPYLQAFEDVNKRVSRLAANIPLIRHNFCPLSFIDVDARDYVGGLLAVYEMNRYEYLRDVFVGAYRRSCQQYRAVRQSLGEPDPFRLQYRNQIGDCIRWIVESNLHGGDIKIAIAQQIENHIASADREKFEGIIEVELKALHEGNIARYRLRPKVFGAWMGRAD